MNQQYAYPLNGFKDEPDDLSDPQKLRAIADWFDKRDKFKSHADRKVQKDLRRIAKQLEE